jgi:ParB family chromosome partitioning protein
LLGDAGATPRIAADGELQHLRVDAITPNPRQPRKTFDPSALEELTLSVRELGVLVPIIVRRGKAAGAYELIAGERRWRAAAAARLTTIPALVRDSDDRASLEVAVVENLQRRDLDPLEEAMGFSNLIEEFGYTQERLAERIGKSRPAVANALRLLGLSDSIKALLRGGEISVGHARALLGVDAGAREALAARIASDGLTVRDVERLGQKREPPPSTPAARAASPAASAKSPDLQAVESRLRYRFAAPASIVPGPKGGRIELRYADAEDLTRLIDLLAPEES